MILIRQEPKELLIEYTSNEFFGGNSWVYEKFRIQNKVKISRVFTFTIKDVFLEDEYSPDDIDRNIKFRLGIVEGRYYRIKSHILGLEHDLYLDTDMNITSNMFIAHTNISIFGRIDDLISESIYIGGDKENAIPIAEFKKLVSQFPTTTEVRHYANSRVSMILEDHLETMTDAQEKLHNYLKKKPLKYVVEKKRIDGLYEYEIEKYKYISDRIQEELKKKSPYLEKDWQDLILKFILLIFPKYIAVLEKVHLKDFYSKNGKPKPRYIDIALVDMDGNIDIIEIKRPLKDGLLRKGIYRGNFTPGRELAGAIMQAEKYIFHLNKWGVNGEKEITKKHASYLPKGMKINVRNPKSLIILGRSDELTDEQKFDFELIKRKYANIMDIITYDDLLKRLNNIIEKLEKNLT